MPEQRQKRRVFGIVLDLMHFGYQETILAGAVDYCREFGIDLLCFATGPLIDGNRIARGKNFVFNLVDESNVDGLIVITTALQNAVGKNVFKTFLSRYYPIPIVSIGEEIDEHSSLVIDNEKGLADLLSHLADAHGYRRLAFITGPRLNTEAMARLNVYKDFLKARGWPFDPSLVGEGDFTAISGRRAVAELMDERKTAFDVIVASNDLMAFGAIEELASRGLVVPGQGSVTGFDDMANSKNASLTTVRQPLYGEGYLAAATLTDMLDGKRAAGTIKLPTELVVRESCGCPSPNLAGCETWTLQAGATAAGGAPLEALLDEAAARLPRPEYSRRWLGALATALSASFERARPDDFVASCRAIVFEAKAAGLNLSSLQELISSLRKVFVARHGGERRRRYDEDQFHRARVMVEEAVRKEESALRISYSLQEYKLNRFGDRISSAGSVEELFDLLHRELPLLGIRSCYLSLFEPSPETARLVFGYDEGRRFAAGARGIAFPAKSLIPDELRTADRRLTLVVHALVHQDKDLGFILLELGDGVELSSVLEYFRAKVSATLQSLILIREISHQAMNLELFNRKLEQSNSALQEFAYVASHDLQEPLRKITAFGERLAQRARAVLDEQGLDYLARMQNAAVRMQKLIESLLSYSRVTTMGKPFVPVDLNQLLRGVLSDLEVRIEKSGARVEAAPLPCVNADPTQMRQLFQNIVGNALKFQKPGAQPVVKVSAREPGPDGGPALAVEDNGIGIDRKFHAKIFGVFQRLHGREEYEGSGIGLAICKKIMERHGGTITVESAPGAGTTFILRFGPDPSPNAKQTASC